MADLQRARTEQVNRESAARLAKQKADQAVVDAADQPGRRGRRADRRRSRRSRPSRPNSTSSPPNGRRRRRSSTRPRGSGRRPPAHAAPPRRRRRRRAAAAGPGGQDWDRDPAAAAPGNAVRTAGWDPTLPAIPSAFVSGDPIAIINAILGIAQTSAQVTQHMGRSFLQKLGILPTADRLHQRRDPAGLRQAGHRVRDQARHGRRWACPYSWGGGNAAGASRGIDSGAGTVGFDCSGLMLYMFAGVGIKLPHYSGSQYDMGRKIPSSQMRRGDVLFYGPNGSQHVAMYLGNGQMLEAPYTGSTVKISPVRTSGMTPYVIRYIEY